MTPDGDDGVVVRRKAAGTLLVDATGRAAHSGAAPDQGRNALLALARTADAVAQFHDPHGPDQLSVVPTVMRSGEAFNVVPAHGELICDMRARSLDAFEPVLASVPAERDEVTLNTAWDATGPGWTPRPRPPTCSSAPRSCSAARSSRCPAVAPRTPAISPRQLP